MIFLKSAQHANLLIKNKGSKVLPASGGRDNGNFPLFFFSFLSCFRLRFHRSSKPKNFPFPSLEKARAKFFETIEGKFFRFENQPRADAEASGA